MDNERSEIDVKLKTDLAHSDNISPNIEKEKIIQIFPNLLLPRGLFLWLKAPLWIHLIITSRRLILVQRVGVGIEKLKCDLGLIGPNAEYVWFKIMDPDEIITKYPDSQVLHLEMVENFRVLKYISSDEERGEEYRWEFFIKYHNNTIRLMTEYDVSPVEQLKDPAIIQLLGEKLDIKGI